MILTSDDDQGIPVPVRVVEAWLFSLGEYLIGHSVVLLLVPPSEARVLNLALVLLRAEE